MCVTRYFLSFWRSKKCLLKSAVIVCVKLKCLAILFNIESHIYLKYLKTGWSKRNQVYLKQKKYFIIMFARHLHLVLATTHFVWKKITFMKSSFTVTVKVNQKKKQTNELKFDVIAIYLAANLSIIWVPQFSNSQLLCNFFIPYWIALFQLFKAILKELLPFSWLIQKQGVIS